MLSLIARDLGTLRSSMVIEGRTDSLPYSTKDVYSNWELLPIAPTRRRIMEHNGLFITQVRGYADRPRVRDKPLDRRNRRVSVIVEGLWRGDA